MRIIAVLALAASVLLGACVSGNGDGGQSPGAEGKVVTLTAAASVTISQKEPRRLTVVAPIPANVSLNPGETTIFTAAAFDQFGRSVANVDYSWRLMDPSAGSITTNGVFQATSVEGSYRGAVAVEAAAPPGFGLGAALGTVHVTVRRSSLDSAPVSIRLFPPVANAEAGQVLFLSALGLDANGALLPGIVPVWRMIDDRAGTVGSAGQFIAGSSPGSYPGAIGVTLPGRPGQPDLTALLDVQISDASTRRSSISVAILPGAVSLRPAEAIDFSALTLDLSDGRRIDDAPALWQINDEMAGSVSADGRFQASLRPGVYPRAVQVEVALEGEVYSATAAVAILEAPNAGGTSDSLPRLSIFPNRLVMSPGESERLTIVGIDSNGLPLPDLQAQWSLDTELGEITQFAQVTAGDSPGVYPEAVVALVEVSVNGEMTTHRLTADFVVRGPLARLEVSPLTANLAPGSHLQYRARAQDANGISLPDVALKWSVLDETAGSISPGGLFTAGPALGEHPGVVEVEGRQILPSP